MARLSNPSYASDIRRIEQLLGGKDPFLSLNQAAQRVGIPLSSLSDAVRSGRMPALTMPDRRRYVRLSVATAYAEKSSADPHIEAQRRLVQRGLLSEVRQTRQRALRPVKRAVVPGKPISETLIEERGRW